MAQTIYLRVSEDLKRAIERKALREGVSVNEFASQTLAEAAGDDAGKAESFATLDIEKTVERLIAAAIAGKTVTYKDVAAASGADWNKVRRLMPAHLEVVWDACVARSLPCLDALVVRQDDGKPGDGFARLAQRKGVQLSDPDAYASMMQRECFQWGERVKRGGAADPLDPWPHLRGIWKGPDTDDIQTYMRGPPDETAPVDK